MKEINKKKKVCFKAVKIKEVRMLQLIPKRQFVKTSTLQIGNLNDKIKMSFLSLLFLQLHCTVLTKT